MLLSLLLACGPAGIKVGDAPRDGGVDTGGDSRDTSSDTSGDSADSGDTAEDPTDVVWTGTAAGSADIVGTDGSHQSASCSGSFTFTITPDGAVSGDIACHGRSGDFLGPVEGDLRGREIVATCAYDGFGHVGEAAVTATLTDSVLDGFVAEQAEGLAVSLLLDGARSP